MKLQARQNRSETTEPILLFARRGAVVQVTERHAASTACVRVQACMR